MDYQSVRNEIETWPIGELKDLLKTCATYASHARGGHERPGRESAHQGGPGGRGHGHAHHCSGRHHRGEGTAGERAGIVTAAVAAGATAHATPDTPDVGSTPAKSFTLRGIKESPPYFHDRRHLIPWRTRSNSSTSSSNSSSTRTRSMRSWPSRRSCDGACSGRVVRNCVLNLHRNYLRKENPCLGSSAGTF
jgi:hypothetical protein